MKLFKASTLDLCSEFRLSHIFWARLSVLLADNVWEINLTSSYDARITSSRVSSNVAATEGAKKNRHQGGSGMLIEGRKDRSGR